MCFIMTVTAKQYAHKYVTSGARENKDRGKFPCSFQFVVRASPTFGSFWEVLGHLILRFAPCLHSVPTFSVLLAVSRVTFYYCFSPRHLGLVGRKKLIKAKSSFLSGLRPALAFSC